MGVKGHHFPLQVLVEACLAIYGAADVEALVGLGHLASSAERWGGGARWEDRVNIG